MPSSNNNRRRFGPGRPVHWDRNPLYLFVIRGIPAGWKERLEAQFNETDSSLKDIKFIMCAEYEGNLCGHVQLMEDREVDLIMLRMTLERGVVSPEERFVPFSVRLKHECFAAHESVAVIGYKFDVTVRHFDTQSVYLPEKEFVHHPCCEEDADAAMCRVANLRIHIRDVGK